MRDCRHRQRARSKLCSATRHTARRGDNMGTRCTWSQRFSACSCTSTCLCERAPETALKETFAYVARVAGHKTTRFATWKEFYMWFSRHLFCSHLTWELCFPCKWSVWLARAALLACYLGSSRFSQGCATMVSLKMKVLHFLTHCCFFFFLPFLPHVDGVWNQVDKQIIPAFSVSGNARLSCQCALRAHSQCRIEELSRCQVSAGLARGNV